MAVITDPIIDMVDPSFDFISEISDLPFFITDAILEMEEFGQGATPSVQLEFWSVS